MGQKVNPIGYRIGFNRTWESCWFANKHLYVQYLLEDFKIRNHVKAKFASAGVSKVLIERSTKKINIFLHTARPGIIIGKKGADIDKVKKVVSSIVGSSSEVFINIIEVKKPETNAQLIADNIAKQLEKRISFRRAMKRSMQACLKFGALGVKVSCAGRLGGAEIARTEWYKEGRIPLHTLRSDIDYGMARSNTTYGVIGVTVYVYKGEKTDYIN
jgi:small subunit ribosomal protein S3